MGEMPVGTVTFLFTDIEGSTRLWQEDEPSMRQAVARHDQLLRDVVAGHGGVVFSTMGDGLAAAFQTASAAVACAVETQGVLHRESWGTLRPLRVRMGMHTGEAESREGDFFGTAVNRAARLAAVGHGGQILCSSTTAEVADESVVLVDLGEHRLRDLDQPMHVFQVGDGSFPPLGSLSAFPGNLPVQLTSFVGRQDEMASVGKALESTRLVTLTGPGGVGKTRLAVQAAANLVTSFPEGVWLCDLAAAVNAESMLQGVAATLGYVPSRSADLEVAIARFAGSRRLLVILDNCEHLLDPAAALVETILERCPNVVIVATSREALGVRGEQVIRLRPLPVPQAGAALEQLAGFDATRLFLDRAGATDADLSLSPTDGAAIAEICRRLDGIPLAIELAAARVIALSPEEIAVHLDQRFRLLTGGWRASVERQHTLRATIDWSYAILNGRDQTVFNHLGVFPGSFDAAAAQAIAAGIEPWDVLDALTSLVAKSMINADRSATGPTRYQMFESLRHYARERLDAEGGSDETRRSHARHYATTAGEIGAGSRGPDEDAWRVRLAAELDNFRAAVTWALASPLEEDSKFAMMILGELLAALYGQTPFLFPGVDYERVVERARGSGSRYASLMMVVAASDAFARGDFRRGRTLSHEGQQEVRLSAYPSAVLNVALLFTDPPGLAATLSAALQLLDEVRAEAWEYASVHGAAAGMAAVWGNVELAQQEAAIALDISRRLGNKPLLALGLYALGLASWQSEPMRAQAALGEYVQIIGTTGYDWALPRVLALRSQLHARAGDHPAALGDLRESIESAYINGDRPAIGTCVARGAAVMAAVGELETAAVFWGAVADGVFARLTALPPNEMPQHEEFVTTVRSQLGDDRYSAATARGAAMTYEQISAFALAAVEDLRQT
jgi:predicted ATPase/class 3 adenylate cyclase